VIIEGRLTRISKVTKMAVTRDGRTALQRGPAKVISRPYIMYIEAAKSAGARMIQRDWAMYLESIPNNVRRLRFQ
jgi:hypothetical protein